MISSIKRSQEGVINSRSLVTSVQSVSLTVTLRRILPIILSTLRRAQLTSERPEQSQLHQKDHMFLLILSSKVEMVLREVKVAATMWYQVVWSIRERNVKHLIWYQISIKVNTNNKIAHHYLRTIGCLRIKLWIINNSVLTTTDRSLYPSSNKHLARERTSRICSIHLKVAEMHLLSHTLSTPHKLTRRNTHQHIRCLK